MAVTATEEDRSRKRSQVQGNAARCARWWDNASEAMRERKRERDACYRRLRIGRARPGDLRRYRELGGKAQFGRVRTGTKPPLSTKSSTCTQSPKETRCGVLAALREGRTQSSFRRYSRVPTRIGDLLGRAVRATGFAYRREGDGSLDRLKRWLAGHASHTLKALPNLRPWAAVEQLLAEAGVCDMAPRRREKWARVLANRLGAGAGIMVLAVLADVARDPRVRSAPAVIARRLPILTSQDPKKATRAPMERIIKSIYDEVGPVDLDRPVGKSDGQTAQAFRALEAYRGGASMAEVAESFYEGKVAEAKAAVTWALQRRAPTGMAE